MNYGILRLVVLVSVGIAGVVSGCISKSDQEVDAGETFVFVIEKDGSLTLEGDTKRNPTSSDTTSNGVPYYVDGEVVDTVYAETSVHGYEPLDREGVQYMLTISGSTASVPSNYNNCSPSVERLEAQLDSLNKRIDSKLSMTTAGRENKVVMIGGSLKSPIDSTYYHSQSWPIVNNMECAQQEGENIPRVSHFLNRVGSEGGFIIKKGTQLVVDPQQNTITTTVTALHSEESSKVIIPMDSLATPIIHPFYRPDTLQWGKSSDGKGAIWNDRKELK